METIMFNEERYRYIIDLLEQNGKVLVKDLSQVFHMSESMVRKDLQTLEKMNLLKRTYGGAINVNHTITPCASLSTRTQQNIDIKESVAKKVCEVIKEHETIFLDASSISFMVAKQLIELNLTLTVITNMLAIASLVPENSAIQFIFIGGDFNPFVGGSIGSYANAQIQHYRCTKAFLGCCGLDLRDGSISTGFSEDASTKKTILNVSRENYLLLLNEKFEQRSSFIFSHLTDYSGLITDSLPDAMIQNQLKEAGVPLL